MTGFKDGAQDAPLAGDDDSEDSEPEAAVSQSTARTEESRESPRQPDRTTEVSSSEQLPWLLRRSSITDEREKTVQLHQQQTTIDREREVKSDVEGRLGESVEKADLREAALLVGLRHESEVVDLLREWGYDF